MQPHRKIPALLLLMEAALALLLPPSLLLPLSTSRAQALTELPATPSVITETGATFLITEVNFKNKEQDYALFKYHSPSGKPFNMKGLKFIDDGTIKEITADVWIAAGQQLALVWKSEQADSIPYLYTDKTGLTGTTEQLVIKSSTGAVLDAVCWTSSAPTASEIKEVEKLAQDGAWHSSSVQSCILSDSIADNISISRKLTADGNPVDSNSALDWQLKDPAATTTTSSTGTTSSTASSTSASNSSANSTTTNPSTSSTASSNNSSTSTSSASSSETVTPPPAQLEIVPPPVLGTTTSASAFASSGTSTASTATTTGGASTTFPPWTGSNGVDLSTGATLSQNNLSTEELAQIAELATNAGFTILPPEGVDLLALDTSKLLAAGSASTKTSSKKSSGSASSKPSPYQNGDLAETITITELLPNPEGTDTTAEWIELTNTGEVAVNLGNWTLDDTEDAGSKPYTIPDTVTLQPGEIRIFPISETKIGLGNTSDSLRLMDFEGTVQSELSYESAPSAQSYAAITVTGTDGEETLEWSWSKEPTPGEPNSHVQQLRAEVVEEPSFAPDAPDADQGYFFLASIENDPLIKKIYFSEDTIAGPLAKNTFRKGTRLLILAEPKDDESYDLKQFELAQQSQPPETSQSASSLGTILLITAILTVTGGWLLWKFVFKKQPTSVAPPTEAHTKAAPSDHA